MRILDLWWDDVSENHIARHGIGHDEVNEVCFNESSLLQQVRRGRYAVYGQTAAGRYLTIILERIRGGTFVPVTARGMALAERRRYQLWRGRGRNR